MNTETRSTTELALRIRRHVLRMVHHANASHVGTCLSMSDILAVPVQRPVVTETTALGAASLAGLASGVFESTEEIAKTWSLDRSWEPTMEEDRRESLYAGWQKAVSRVLADR